MHGEAHLMNAVASMQNILSFTIILGIGNSMNHIRTYVYIHKIREHLAVCGNMYTIMYVRM